jgi:hypothetical protein
MLRLRYRVGQQLIDQHRTHHTSRTNASAVLPDPGAADKIPAAKHQPSHLLRMPTISGVANRDKRDNKLPTLKVDGSVRKIQPIGPRRPNLSTPRATDNCGRRREGHDDLESSYTIHDAGRNTNDSEDEEDLPSLESLLRGTPAPPSSKPDRDLGHRGSTGSTIQIQGWKETIGPDGTPILEELPEHERTGKEQWPMTGRAPDKPMLVPHNRLTLSASSRATTKRLRRGAQTRQTKKRPKRLDTRKQAELSRVRELEEAKTEWAQRGYPKICWRRLRARLQKFSPALRGVLNGNSPSFYHAELELAIARKEDRKYRCMENSTAGYYGPRGQQIL